MLAVESVTESGESAKECFEGITGLATSGSSLGLPLGAE